ncbi:MAG TPA: DUF3618 domain-containing protein [Microvirga sp.]|jgi:hypothetical protein|nr:DUF3618 domain-containing protein [Microvirga sp.]
MTQDIRDLERDIEQTRARLDLTIDRLQDKLSMSGIVDDVLGTMRGNRYGSIYDHALDVIKRNPVPVMLVAAGVGWLIYRMGPNARQDGTTRLPYDDAEMPVIDRHRPRAYRPAVPPLPVGEAASLPRRDALEPRRELDPRRL